MAVSSLAGRGRLESVGPADGADGRDPGRFDSRHAHCEVLVVGAGESGRKAAAVAQVSNPEDRVLLIDADPAATGDGVRSGMTALGIYDHGYVTAVERRPTPTTEGRLWHIRARRIVIATGATERPIVFADDDRPGIMLAGAAATYVERYGVRPGDRAVIFTNNGTTDAVAAAIAGRRRRGRRDRRRACGRPRRRHERRRRRAPDLGDDRARRRRSRDRGGRPAARVRRLEPERGALDPRPRHAPVRRADRGVRPGQARSPRPDRGGRCRRRRDRGPRRDRPDLGRATARARDRRCVGDPLRRCRSRRDRARPAAGARRRPRVDRARQALHDDRHRHRAGAQWRRRRERDRRIDPGSGSRCRGRADVPPADRAGQLRAARRPRPRRHARRPRPDDPDPGVARRERRGLRGRRPVEAAALLPARRRVDGRGCAARMRRRADWRGRDGRDDARQDRHPGSGRRDLPGPGLHEHVLDPQAGVVPVRAHVPRRTGWSSTTA